MNLEEVIKENLSTLWKDIGDGAFTVKEEGDKEFLAGIQQHYEGVIAIIAEQYAIDWVRENAREITEHTVSGRYIYEPVDHSDEKEMIEDIIEGIVGWADGKQEEWESK